MTIPVLRPAKQDKFGIIPCTQTEDWIQCPEMSRFSVDESIQTALAHHRAGRLTEAETLCREIITAQPDHADALHLLGVVLAAREKVDEAIAIIRRAIAYRPGVVEAHQNLADLLTSVGRWQEVVQAYRQMIGVFPTSATAHCNLAQALLRLGNMPQGLDEYEYRWKVDDSPIRMPKYPAPIWDGAALNGKRILLWPEQGFGDMIQFARYVPMVAKHGGRVVLASPVELAELMRTLDGVERVITHGAAQEPADCHFPIMSLPRIFRTTLDTIPAEVPYLRADRQRVERWSGRLGNDRAVKKIGLAWAGRPTHRRDRERSIDPQSLAPLLAMPGTTFVSLQKGPAAAQAREYPRVVDASNELNDFADTAALIETLDLVISVDTAVAHLAGALGKPVYLLLPSHADWRWMVDRTDSPWYPTMRLFRQSRPGDWAGVVTLVCDAAS